MAPTIPVIDLRMADLERLVDRTRHTPLTEDEHATLKAAIDTLGYLAHLVEQKGTTLDGLRQLHYGDRCPSCPTGKVYRQRDPRVLIRLVGQAPITATVYALEKLRCHLCGELFTAEPPPAVGLEKYDKTAGAMVALLKYGSGMPCHRLEASRRIYKFRC